MTAVTPITKPPAADPATASDLVAMQARSRTHLAGGAPRPARYVAGPPSRLLSRWVLIGRRGYAAYHRAAVRS